VRASSSLSVAIAILSSFSRLSLSSMSRNCVAWDNVEASDSEAVVMLLI
jgi:hypothetical protein